MWYVYVLYSLKDGKFYVGCTNDLRERIKEHNQGKVKSTKERRPLQLIYYEACWNKKDAYKREKYLKSGYGKRTLKKRLKYGLQDVKYRSY
jgi:putative endonuclease